MHTRRSALLGLIAIVLAGAGGLVRPATGSTASITVDASAQTHQSSAATTITLGSFSTTHANDLVLAFLASDGSGSPNTTSFSSVAGGGLTWKLRQRTNAQPGTAEIWEAVAASALTGATITATRSSGAYVGFMDIVAFSGADTTVDGATGSSNATSGAPSVSLTTTRAGSWVWGVGDDFDNAIDRTVGPGQTLFDQDLAPTGDTYWTQSQSAPGNAANVSAVLNDTAPTSDRWDLSSIEVLPAVVDTTPPSVPTGLKATAISPNQVSLSWNPSTDDVSVAGYNVLRNGTQIGSTPNTAYIDSTAAQSTTYSYSVSAFDPAGNVSSPSSPVMVTTPPASSSPPVITNVTTTAIAQGSATIQWNTDIPSSSQVMYGTSPSYTQSTTLDSSQVTSHSQTLTGLVAATTYHYEVQSTGSNNNSSVSPDQTLTTLATNITLPDFQVLIPTANISIGTAPGTGHRQLQYTHNTWDSGTGPFGLNPTYSSASGTATFTQGIYKSTSPGSWTLDHTVPVNFVGAYDAPIDKYQFPIGIYTLNSLNPDGTPGAVVAASPKTEFCITADTYIGGVPNTPNSTTPPATNCGDPTQPLGWSVGWGDQYDQMDPGQSIDLTGVADGTYVLHTIANPYHVLQESNLSNNVVDTTLHITGNSVSVISQTTPNVIPPGVSMVSPTPGSSVSGTVTIQASATPSQEATVKSVQFVLDGLPLGTPVTAAPYTLNWQTGNTTTGNHVLAAQVVDSSGNVNQSAPVAVTVSPTNPPPDTTPPTVNITNPSSNQTVTGTVPVDATATDDTAVTSVQFYVDGVALGSPVTTAPYAVQWDTTTASNGSHTLTAKATDTAGLVGTAPNVTVTVQNPGPPMACFVLQAQVTAHAKGTATAPAFHTAMTNEVLVAFVSADGPGGAGTQSGTVSGAGVTWTLVKRANAQAGDAEIWEAAAPSILTNATVKVVMTKSYNVDLTVIAMEGAKGVGASVAASAPTGAPSVRLTTTGATSLVFAVGHDFDNDVARTLPNGWVMLEQWLDPSTGDTYWSQYTNQPTGAAGSSVTVSDVAPTNDQWNLAAMELLNDGS